jgi:protein-S-isoprenylcysteine O-methyltransferase Ste14
MLVGIAAVLRYCWIWIFQNDSTPDSSDASAQTTEPGLLHCWRNAALLGTWMSGIGLAVLLRSPCLLGLVGTIMTVGIFYPQRHVKPTVSTGFAKFSLPRLNCIPRWIILVFVVASTATGAPDISIDKPLPPANVEPAILVQIRCKPGTSYLWKTDFDNHIRPAIDEAVARGNTFTGFQFIQAVLPSQSFHFILVFTGKTFAGLDKPGPFPHYVALFDREGTLRASDVLKEMMSYEEQATVTLVYLKR